MIKGLSEQLRMPRLGKIHLGYRDEKKKGAPTATDYFVCPEVVTKAIGNDKPKQLQVMIPTEDEEYWASQYYRAYSQTRGLICRGDGETYRRMIDVETKEIAGKDTKSVAWVDGVCPGRECPIYQAKKCSEMMCLQFMLPSVPGVGVWQVDTGSINSIRNINSEAHLIRQLCGHISMLPLLLTLEQEEKQIPETGKKRQLYFLHLRERDTLQTLLRDSQRPVFELLAPPVDESQAARDIADLWPGEEKKETLEQPTESEPISQTLESKKKAVIEQSNAVVPTEIEQPPGTKKDEMPAKTKRDPTTIKNIEQLAKALKEDFGLSYQQMWDELNIKSWNDLTISPVEAYRNIAISY